MRRVPPIVSLPVLFALGAAGSASAQVMVQDRYGPPPAQAMASPSTADGAPVGFLGWPGKTAPRSQPSPGAAARPEPLALARQFDRRLTATLAPAPAPLRALPPPQAPQPAAVAASGDLPPFRPGSEPVLRGGGLDPAQAGTAPALLGGPPAQASIYDAPPPAPAPVAVAAAPRAPGAGGQLYSLHRQYGLTPDAIPAPPSGQHYILVGPPDEPAPPADDEATDDGPDAAF